MAASLRELRGKIKSTQATKKITRAMELIAASRIIKAQQQAQAALPYARELTRAVSAVATFSNVDHPLTTEHPDPKRAAVVIITSDRGLAGSYSSALLKESERLVEKLHSEGKEVDLYVSGRKGIAYFTFRQRDLADSWSGYSDSPTYEAAREIAEAILAAFLAGDESHEESDVEPAEDNERTPVDEVHVVFTRFRSMLVQEPDVIRLLPLEVVEGVADDDDQLPQDGDILPLYEFEPSAAEVLDALLPRYVTSRIFAALLQAAASELAARQRAMKSATDNAEDLIQKYTRIANQARQAGITQEISEIVGGANALADANAGSE
ncbi:MAG: F0F1 ATP synthase subunit gamma [Nocardioidaceae bacterium]|nr:F0F1 ATP synthase subunit gamma [Nocardioidaceae bacterium]